MKTPFSLDSVIATFVPLWAMALKKFRQDTPIVFQRARCKNDEFRFYQIVAGKKMKLVKGALFAPSLYANEAMHFPFNYARYSGHVVGFLPEESTGPRESALCLSFEDLKIHHFRPLFHI